MTRPSDRAIAQAFWALLNAGTGKRTLFECMLWIDNHAREIDAAAPEGAQAVAMPDPVGWCRVKNGQHQVQIGGERPHDRGNGDHSPWANLYDGPALRAYGKACASAVSSAPPSLDAEDGARLAAIGELIRTQDNRITDSPIFIVQQRRRIYGIEDGYCENFVWIDGDNSYTDEERAVRDAERAENEEAEVEYRQCGYIDIWEFVTACFTEQGCKDYLKRDGHNLREPRIYAAGSYRNEEWRFVRKQLLSIAARAAEGKGDG